MEIDSIPPSGAPRQSGRHHADRAALLAAIERQRDCVLDWDIATDDACAEVTRALQTFAAARQERDRAAADLQSLLLEFTDRFTEERPC